MLPLQMSKVYSQSDVKDEKDCSESDREGASNRSSREKEKERWETRQDGREVALVHWLTTTTSDTEIDRMSSSGNHHVNDEIRYPV